MKEYGGASLFSPVVSFSTAVLFLVGVICVNAIGKKISKNV